MIKINSLIDVCDTILFYLICLFTFFLTYKITNECTAKIFINEIYVRNGSNCIFIFFNVIFFTKKNDCIPSPDIFHMS